MMAIFHPIQITIHILLKSAFSMSIRRPQDRTRFRCFSIRSALPPLAAAAEADFDRLLCGDALADGLSCA
jgi:hypothetical protein